MKNKQAGAKNKQVIIITAVSLAVLIVAATAGLLLSGYATVVWKKPTDQVLLSRIVCDDALVKTYNDAALYQQRNGDEAYTLDNKAMEKVVDDIKAKSDYQGDPTCQMILLMSAIDKKDYSAAKELYQRLKDLHAKHLYVNSDLEVGGSLSAYESFVEELSPAKQKPTKEPQGGA